MAVTRLSPGRCTFGAFFDGQSGTNERQGMAEDAFDYDLLVIGSGPAGQRAAIQGAMLDKKVAIVERKAVIGGCSVNLGTIPSKTLRDRDPPHSRQSGASAATTMPLRGFGFCFRRMLRARWAWSVREALAGNPMLMAIIDPLFDAARALRDQLAIVEKRVRDAARHDPACRRL